MAFCIVFVWALTLGLRGSVSRRRGQKEGEEYKGEEGKTGKGSTAAPTLTTTVNPIEPAKCPDYRGKASSPDCDGECQCEHECIREGIFRNCPSSDGIGGWAGEYFSVTCEDCTCSEEAPPRMKCPDFAKDSEATSNGDCRCEHECIREGIVRNCPCSRGIGDYADYFSATCQDCTCSEEISADGTPRRRREGGDFSRRRFSSRLRWDPSGDDEVGAPTPARKGDDCASR